MQSMVVDREVWWLNLELLPTETFIETIMKTIIKTVMETVIETVMETGGEKVSRLRKNVAGKCLVATKKYVPKLNRNNMK